MPRLPRNKRRLGVATMVKKIPGGVHLAGLGSLLLFLGKPGEDVQGSHMTV